MTEDKNNQKSGKASAPRQVKNKTIPLGDLCFIDLEAFRKQLSSAGISFCVDGGNVWIRASYKHVRKDDRVYDAVIRFLQFKYGGQIPIFQETRSVRALDKLEKHQWIIEPEKLAEILAVPAETVLRALEKPRIFGTVDVDILNAFFYIERRFHNGGALEYTRGKCFTLAQMHELKKKVIIETDRPITTKRATICLAPFTEQETRDIIIPGPVLKTIVKNDEAAEILAMEHAKREPGVYFRERSRLNEAFVELLKQKTPEQFDELVNDFLFEAHRVDPRVRIWGESTLIHPSHEPDDCYLMKYRGHALIVKNAKSGFTSVALKVGKCYPKGTEASLRGFSDGKTDRPSALNEDFGSVVIDEFLDQDPLPRA
jgi:hypothetical protein